MPFLIFELRKFQNLQKRKKNVLVGKTLVKPVVSISFFFFLIPAVKNVSALTLSYTKLVKTVCTACCTRCEELDLLTLTQYQLNLENYPVLLFIIIKRRRNLFFFFFPCYYNSFFFLSFFFFPFIMLRGSGNIPFLFTNFQTSACFANSEKALKTFFIPFIDSSAVYI